MRSKSQECFDAILKVQEKTAGISLFEKKFINRDLNKLCY